MLGIAEARARRHLIRFLIERIYQKFVIRLDDQWSDHQKITEVSNACSSIR